MAEGGKKNKVTKIALFYGAAEEPERERERGKDNDTASVEVYTPNSCYCCCFCRVAFWPRVIYSD